MIANGIVFALFAYSVFALVISYGRTKTTKEES